MGGGRQRDAGETKKRDVGGWRPDGDGKTDSQIGDVKDKVWWTGRGGVRSELLERNDGGESW